MFKRAKASMILLSLAYLALGIVLTVYPAMSLRLLCMLVGVIILGCGILSLVRYAKGVPGFFMRQFLLISGILCCAVGAFLLFSPDLIIGAVPVVFGLFIVFDSLVRFGDVLQLRKTDTPIWGMLALVVLSCGLGIMMVFNPFATAEVMMTAIGAVLIVEAVLNLCTVSYTHVQVKRWLKLHPEVLDSAENGKPSVPEGQPVAVDVAFRDAESAPTGNDAATPASPDTADSAGHAGGADGNTASGADKDTAGGN